jgi:carbon monoxide dehydrogenase subunit G
MDNISNFESRSGQLTCKAEEVFNFVTDLRNFERFVPVGTITDWQAQKESCSFNVSMIGTVSLRLSEKVTFSKVVYDGDALKQNDFSLLLNITDNGKEPAGVKVRLSADLNPMLKMMAAKPIGQFLEMLINEMENFKNWKDAGE